MSRRIHGNIILYTIQRTRLLQIENIRMTTNTRRIKRRTRNAQKKVGKYKLLSKEGEGAAMTVYI